MDRWKTALAERAGETPGSAHELAAARDGAIVCDLSGYALLRFDGEDAETFLHGQLSSDVRALATDRGQLATYNSPKGRMLAALLLWRAEDGFLMQLRASIGASIAKRLSMYILRSKVRVEDASAQYARIGVGGPKAGTLLAAAGVALPAWPLGLVRGQRIDAGARSIAIDYALRLGDDRHELLFSSDDDAVAMCRSLEALGVQAATEAPWRWLTLKSGVAEIEPSIQDEFVPQMLNYELIGGISFDKGCYPGQEIVARTHYRGGLKRRTLLAHALAAALPAPGTPIFAQGHEQPVGAVVNAAPSPAGGCEVLACIHLELARGELHLGAADGVRLELLPMPYAIPAAA